MCVVVLCARLGVSYFGIWDFGVMCNKMDTLKRTIAIQKWLRRRDFSGFILPCTDAHQGEYIAAYARRVFWLTGFSGSAGTAVVTRGACAIFVDGRYTLQATKEINQNIYAIHNVASKSVDIWLKETLKPGDKIAYDPWLFTRSQIRNRRSFLDAAGMRLIAVNENPIDALWGDQPPPPLGKVEIYPLKYAGVSRSKKTADVVRKINERQLDAYIFTRPDSIAWLFNIRGRDVPFTPVMHGYAIVYKDSHAEIYTDKRKVPRRVETALGAFVKFRESSTFIRVISALAGKVGTDFSHVSYAIFSALAASKAEIIHMPDMVSMAKAFKNRIEQASMREYHIFDGLAMVRMLHFIDTTPFSLQDEWRNAKKLEYFRSLAPGFRGHAFDTISAFGSNGALCHYCVSKETAQKFTNNNLYLIDSGSQYVGATTDVTRTVPIGVPSFEHKHNFTLVLKGFIALARLQFPKHYTLDALDVIARAPLFCEKKTFDHGTGHGVGAALSVHEGPFSISPKGKGMQIDVGVIFSNEPGYYVPGAYGIRIENLMIAQDAGVNWLRWENITWCPIDTRLIEISLLDKGERQWLNTYHRETLEKIGSLLQGPQDASILSWLERRCRPI